MKKEKEVEGGGGGGREGGEGGVKEMGRGSERAPFPILSSFLFLLFPFSFAQKKELE